MECPKCKRDVITLHGNGKYPNSTYKCGTCYDNDLGKVVAKFIIVIAIVLIIIATGVVLLS